MSSVGTETIRSGRARILPIPYGYIPAEGSRCAAASYDWTGQASYTDDVSRLAMSGLETAIQSVYVDNAGNGQAVTLSFPVTEYSPTCPAYSQAIFPILAAPGQFTLTTAAPIAATTRLTFTNVPVPPRVVGPAQPSVDLNFLTGAVDSRIVYTGANGTYFDATGTLTAATTNIPRIDYNPVTLLCNGLLIEEARTNSIRNSTMQGVIPGSPGSGPTNWNPATAGGLVRAIVGSGVENGIAYVDFQVTGTTAGSSSFGCPFETSLQIAAVAGQIWTASAYFKLTAGSFGTGVQQIYIQESDAAGAFLTNGGVTVAMTGARQRFAITRTLVNASTAFVSSNAFFFYSSTGETVNFTVRIYAPQLELGGFATSFIPTSTVAVTRASDNATLISAGFTSPAGATVTEYFVNQLSPGSNCFVINLNDITNNNAVQQYFNPSVLVAGVNAGGVSQYAASTPETPVGRVCRTGISWSVGPCLDALNGTVTNTGTAAATPTTMNRMNIGAWTNSSGFFVNGWIRRIRYWPRALPANELITVTT